ncbi:uncharacterized protein LOC142181950 [Nicotiana tabacum]|uniref:Uncharacterized protein LOC142181950 n=1 Tax=Nicotiana tabacum TaxID=4097 RepID=A0AC58UQJ4_TOBAC
MENYTIWSQAMEVSLLTWNKLGFINGSITRYTYGDKYANIWNCCNAIVKSRIKHNVSRDLLSGVLFRSSAYAIWLDLWERFDKVNASRIYYLHREIFTLTQGTYSVSVYYTKLKDLWDEYDSIMPPPICYDKLKKFTEHQEYQHLWQFLMGLNDGYSQARSQILMTSKIPTVNQAYAMILQDESQKLVAGGHTKEECYKLMKCDYCNKKGHLKANCYKLIVYPADFKPLKRANMEQQNLGPMQMFTPRQYSQILNLLNKASVSDSFANTHMASNITYEQKADEKWIVDIGAQNICICQLDGGNTINNVLCVPVFKFNFSSVSQLTKAVNYCAAFFPNFCIFQDLFTGRVKEIGKEEEGLYMLHSQRRNKNTIRSLVMAAHMNKAELWHKRMGHVPV